MSVSGGKKAGATALPGWSWPASWVGEVVFSSGALGWVSFLSWEVFETRALSGRALWPGESCRAEHSEASSSSQADDMITVICYY